MSFSTHIKEIENLANLFKVLIKLGLKISAHKCQFLRGHLTYIGFTFMLKVRKSS